MTLPTLDAIATKPDSVRTLPRADRFSLGQRALTVAWILLFSMIEDDQAAREEDGRLLSAKEAAPRFGLSLESLYKRWRVDPAIRACSVDNGTNRPLFDPARIREWQQKRRRKA